MPEPFDDIAFDLTIDGAFDRAIDGEIDDVALTLLALDAVSHDPFQADLEPFRPDGAPTAALLPEWYMPAPGSNLGRRGTIVMVGVAISLLVVNLAGFCVTWGWPEFVWKG